MEGHLSNVDFTRPGSSAQYLSGRLQKCGGLSPPAPMVPLSELSRRPRKGGGKRAAPAGIAFPDKSPAVRS